MEVGGDWCRAGIVEAERGLICMPTYQKALGFQLKYQICHYPPHGPSAQLNSPLRFSSALKHKAGECWDVQIMLCGPLNA